MRTSWSESSRTLAVSVKSWADPNQIRRTLIDSKVDEVLLHRIKSFDSAYEHFDVSTTFLFCVVAAEIVPRLQIYQFQTIRTISTRMSTTQISIT